MFNFTVKEFLLGGGTGTPTLQFYKRGFELNSNNESPSWQDIILSGNTALTLTNALANGLNYLKLFGGTEQNGTPTPDNPMDIVSNNGVVKAFKTLNISTYDTSASDAGIDIAFDGVTDRRKWDTLNDSGTGTKHYENGFVSIYMDTSGNSYYAKALVDDVVYDGSVYNTGERIDSWPYNIAKNIDIYCPTINADGITETVQVTGKNLWNPNGVDYGWISTSGEFSADGVSRMVEVEQGETYTYKSYSSTNSFFNCIALYDANKNFIANTRRIITTGDTKTNTVTITDANVKYLACSYYTSGDQREPDWQMIVEGTGDIPYEPYFNGGQATAEMLLSVGDYKDVQSVLDGNVTRNVGIKVLDGTEPWVSAGTGATAEYLVAITKAMFSSDIDTSATYNSFLCSHLKMGNNDAENTLSISSSLYGVRLGLNASITGGSNTKIANTKQWLADQYANGTPVIIVYPLATPTTETVTGQPLTTQAGSNTISIVQGSIDNLGLEVSYKAVV